VETVDWADTVTWATGRSNRFDEGVVGGKLQQYRFA
jgi:hypothetical protein